jgi:hypothetical protein
VVPPLHGMPQLELELIHAVEEGNRTCNLLR